MTKAGGKLDHTDIREDVATTVNPECPRAGGAEHGTIALSKELLARGRAVLLDGALPSTADALCMLAPPFGEGVSAVHRFIDIWARQPLARSFDARRALDDVSVDDEDLALLRDVLARDLAMAPEAARAPIEEAILQMDVSLAWTLGGLAAAPLAGLAACHAARATNPDERLLAAASTIALLAAGGHMHGFPATGILPPSVSSQTDPVVGFVASVEKVLRAFADRHLKAYASAAASLAADESKRSAIISGETKALLRAVPQRLHFVDSGVDGIVTFSSLICPASADAVEASAAERAEGLRQDCRSWATQMIVAHAHALPVVDGLMGLMGDLTIGQRFTIYGLNETLDALDMLAPPEDPDDPVAARLADILSLIKFRLRLYAAHLGDPASAAKLAAWSAGFALTSINRTSSWPMAVAALGWAERAAVGHPAALSSSRALGLPRMDEMLEEAFASRLDRIAAELAYALGEVTIVREGDTGHDERTFEGLWRASIGASEEVRRSAIARADMATATPAVDKDTIVVVRSIAESKGYSTKDMHADWLGWVNKPVPLVFTRDVQKVFRKLVAEAPHARSVIDVILRDTTASRAVVWRPTMLVGQPGSGKTLLAIRVCEELGVPYRIFPCGGASDSSFGGTSRQWSTGRPSIPLQTVRQHGVANVAIILDEVEKVAHTRHHGNLIDVLLAMLEPLNASRVFDLYLEGEVDLSRVLWMATANDVSGLHPALLDRFRILEMSDPRAEHLHALLPSVVGSVAERRGLSPAWIAPFDTMEMDFIADLWRGGSIRRLARIVEALLDARERPERAN
jgi:ATPase family protein associated with various cellular activities (AAA)